MTGGWGEPSSDSSVVPNGVRRMTEGGGFHAIKIRPEGLQAILKSKAVSDAVESKTVAMAQFAQSVSITEDAYYEAKVLYKDHPTWPARGFVVAENYKAVIDDRYHSTLLKTAAHFPSDAPWEHPPMSDQPPPPPTAKSSTRADGLWTDKNGRWRNAKGHYQRAPEDA